MFIAWGVGVVYTTELDQQPSSAMLHYPVMKSACFDYEAVALGLYCSIVSGPCKKLHADDSEH